LTVEYQNLSTLSPEDLRLYLEEQRSYS